MGQPDRFHDGERRVQERSGEREAALRNGALIGEAIPARAIPFLAEQRLLALGSVAAQGAVWASVVFGARGFVTSAEGRSVVIDRTLIEQSAGDPLWSNVRAGVEVGLLAIELESRRRLRVNGLVHGSDDAHVEITVREAYPNCPKYIQRRHVGAARKPQAVDTQPAICGVPLDAVRTHVIERADTLFVASRHPTRGVDVSHRGGPPGFVRVLDPTRLRIPDYRGNSMFNTLGNFLVDDRAGLVFMDFERGRLLQMTGTVAIRFDEEEDSRQPTGGTGRYWDFHVATWLESRVGAPLAWELLDYSPYNPGALA
jgi:predicted pyridoxine 5'-phosphate oxidase superfamily flavin-nucleotide-binding protein